MTQSWLKRREVATTFSTREKCGLACWIRRMDTRTSSSLFLQSVKIHLLELLCSAVLFSSDRSSRFSLVSCHPHIHTRTRTHIYTIYISFFSPFLHGSSTTSLCPRSFVCCCKIIFSSSLWIFCSLPNTSSFPLFGLNTTSFLYDFLRRLQTTLDRPLYFIFL